MTRIESPVVRVAASPAKVSQDFQDWNTFGELLAAGPVSDFKAEGDKCSFKVTGGVAVHLVRTSDNSASEGTVLTLATGGAHAGEIHARRRSSRRRRRRHLSGGVRCGFEPLHQDDGGACFEGLVQPNGGHAPSTLLRGLLGGAHQHHCTSEDDSHSEGGSVSASRGDDHSKRPCPSAFTPRNMPCQVRS